MGVGGHTKGLQQITARPRAKSYLPIFLCLSEAQGPHAKPVTQFLSAQGEAEVWGKAALPTSRPLFLTWHDPAQEGNVCVSIQTLLVWPFPFAARVSWHRLQSATQVCQRARSVCREERMPTSAGRSRRDVSAYRLPNQPGGSGVNQVRVERSKRLFSPNPARATSWEPPPCRRARGEVKSAATLASDAG